MHTVCVANLVRLTASFRFTIGGLLLSEQRKKNVTMRSGSQGGLKEYNERLVLHVVRRFGEIPSADIVRETGLSVQSVSRIVRRLLDMDLLMKRDRQRVKGKVGQPSVPIALNPDGACAVGVKIGRRSLDVLVVDLLGSVLHRVREQYDYPDPDYILPRVNAVVAEVLDALPAQRRQRAVGIGVAAPYGLGDRPDELSGPPEVLARWGEVDIKQALASEQSLPVWFEHDAKAACMADLLFHRTGTRFGTYLYVFIGTIIGGAVVMDDVLCRGSFGYAGAFGPMPVPSCFDPNDNNSGHATVPLLRCASRYLLDERIRDLGLDPHVILPASGSTEQLDLPIAALGAIESWLETAAPSIAVAVLGACSTIDFAGVVIDGALPETVITRLTQRIDACLEQQDFTGLIRPKLVAGTIGDDARALGGAVLPLYSSFAPDREVLLSISAQTAT